MTCRKKIKQIKERETKQIKKVDVRAVEASGRRLETIKKSLFFSLDDGYDFLTSACIFFISYV